MREISLCFWEEINTNHFEHPRTRISHKLVRIFTVYYPCYPIWMRTRYLCVQFPCRISSMNCRYREPQSRFQTLPHIPRFPQWLLVAKTVATPQTVTTANRPRTPRGRFSGLAQIVTTKNVSSCRTVELINSTSPSKLAFHPSQSSSFQHLQFPKMLQKLVDLSAGSLVLLFSSIFILYFLLQYALDPLRDIPGPFLARFTRWWYFFEIYKGSFEVTNVGLHKKYGPIVRIAPNEYSIDDVEAARLIYGHGNAFVKVCHYYFPHSLS
jgi:hypothetical protein